MNPGVRSSTNCSRCPRSTDQAPPPKTSPMPWGAHGSSQTVHAEIGQRVGAFVARIAVVAAHPVPLHVVLCRQSLQALPKFHVLHRFLVGGAPAALLPAV